jgi:hypothetical protein
MYVFLISVMHLLINYQRTKICSPLIHVRTEQTAVDARAREEKEEEEEEEKNADSRH